MTTIEKIRAEIERRLKYTHDWLRGDEKRHPKQTSVSKNYYKMKGDERTLDALLSFLDTLEEPKKDYNKLYDDIAKSEWFKKSYVGKSLGDVVPVEEPVCDNLEKEAVNYCFDNGLNLSPRVATDFARHFANWQKAQDDKIVDIIYQQGIEKGKDEQKEQFEKNRNDACDRMTKEEYELETDFALGIINKENRTPTFIDAINYGMRMKKEQMLKEAVEGEVFYNPYPTISLDDCKDYNFKDNQKVRIIICKKED